MYTAQGGPVSFRTVKDDDCRMLGSSLELVATSGQSQYLVWPMNVNE
jgi:hypothetical protein